MAEHAPIPVLAEPTDVHALLAASLEPLVRQAAASRVALKIAKLGDVPSFAFDREKIAWAVTTLVGNALRYVTSGDSRDDAGGSVVVHVAWDASAREASISVQDDGPGIPTEKLPFLFERKEGAVHAEGLSLSLVRQIITAHGGRIDVECRRHPDDHGTSITIVLPAARGGELTSAP